MTDIEPLSQHEVGALAHHETTIEEGLKGFVSVGNALRAIRDEKLYRSEFDTFVGYCRARWDLGHAHAYRLISGSELAERIPDMSNEAQARELGKLPYTEQEKVWDRAKLAASLEAREVTAPDIKSASNEPSVTTARPDREAVEPWKYENETELYDLVLNAVVDLRNGLVELANHPQGVWLHTQMDNCEVRLNDIHNAVKFARPAGPCPACDGGLDPRCHACRGRGWLPHGRLEAVRKAAEGSAP